MDAALAATLDALLDPSRVVWTKDRVQLGQEPGEDALFLGVGSREASLPPHPRMFSWKLPQWRTRNLRSTTEAVLQSAAVLDALSLPLELWQHDPTLDCLTAAVLAVHRVIHKRWPDGHEALAEYVSEWEQGRTEQAGHYARALASVYYASMQLFRSPSAAPAPELAQLLVGALERRLDASGLQALPTELIPSRIARRLKADADLYRAELSRAWKVQLDLPVDNQPDAWRRIDALFLSSPQDVTVLKLLARPDAESSSYGRGFELMATHAPNEPNVWGRHTISIAPESPGTLDDLALRLDRLEGDVAPDGSPRVKGKPRFTHQPPELEGLADPWYSDGYAWTKRRSTIVAPPFAGTRLTREQIWEAIWQRFHVGRNVHVTASRTLFCRPFRATRRYRVRELLAAGWQPMKQPPVRHNFLPSVTASFAGGDVLHLERAAEGCTLHLSLYPSQLTLVWAQFVEQRPTTLLELAQRHAGLGRALDELAELRALGDTFEPVENSRWQPFGAYRINRARSTMLDDSRSVRGLFHAVASGEAPTLENLPSDAEDAARRVQVLRDVEHWFTPTGGARLELRLDDASDPPGLDEDFALFLLTTGQRYAAFELTRRMGDVERASRTRRWQRMRPTRQLRADVMLFTNSLWYPRVSDAPELNARYDAWRELHGMERTVDSLREQTTELDEYRKERFEDMVGMMLFIFLPITIASGFFSGAQFNEMELRVGLPWTTGGWILFLAYTAFFSVLVFGAVIALRLFSARKRR
ncbi:MAG: hypothetical protein ACOZQL_39795 [Myxococcota bacterium]